MTDVRDRLRAAGSAVAPPQPAFDRLRLRRDRKHRHDRLTAGVVAVLVAAGGVGGALALLSRSGHRPVRPGDQPAGLGLGQYFYLKSTVLGQDGSTIVEQTWWAPDGSGEIRFDTDRPDKYASWPPVGTYDAGRFPVMSDISSLSTDPSVLEDQLRRRSGRDGASPQPDVTPTPGVGAESGQLWRAVMGLLDPDQYPNALPELRAALFDVAATLEGVSRENGVLDPVGRPAVALEYTDDGSNWRLYFDPTTHQLMDQAVTPFDGGPVPFEFIESGIVDSLGAEPTQDQLLVPAPVTEPTLSP